MQALFALLPILLILLLMVGWRWSAAAAGVVGLLIAAATALMAFGFGTVVYRDLGPAGALTGVFAEAVFVAATILWIIFPALCIFELQSRSGAFDVLKSALSNLSAGPRITAILVGWFFGLFMEGAAGFGTPVALGAPILVSLGFAPLQSVTLMLVGHAAGVSFGAVGTPVFPQIAVTGFTGLEIASVTAALHGMLGWILLAFLAVVAGRNAPASPLPDQATGGTSGATWLWACIAAPCFLVPFFLIAAFVGPELPTLGGSLVGAAAFIGFLRWSHRYVPGLPPTPGQSGSALFRAGLPYLTLLALILATRLLPTLRELLQGLLWNWSLFGAFSGTLQPLYHPGTMLLLGFLLGGLLQRQSVSEILGAAGRAARRLAPVVVALVAMLALSRVMVHAGMISALADAAAEWVGSRWPLLVPAVGVLGSFVTGSATASNILLTDFQEATAQALGLPVLHLVAGQGFGAAVGNIVCPHNLIAGAATVGLIGREGEILRRTALPCSCYAAAGGALLFFLVS